MLRRLLIGTTALMTITSVSGAQPAPTEPQAPTGDGAREQRQDAGQPGAPPVAPPRVPEQPYGGTAGGQRRGPTLQNGQPGMSGLPMQPPLQQQMQRARVFVQPPERLERAAFMGVSGSPVMAALREQLKLPKGVGLVADFVEAKSPAADAGVKQYDVLHKLGDQLLVNAHQFAVLVRMHKPGDEVALTLIRQGESKIVQVKLTEREVAALDDANPWGMPPGPWQDAAGADVLMFKPVAPMKMPSGGDPKFRATIRLDGRGQRSEMRYADDEGQVVVVQEGDGRHVRATDKSGTVTYEGVVASPEQMKALPEAVRAKVERMEEATPPLPVQPAPTAPGADADPAPRP